MRKTIKNECETVRIARRLRICALFTIAIAMVIPFAARADDSPADFSGTWRMDASRSVSAHQDVPIGPVTMVIKQRGNDLSMEISSTEAHSSTVHREILVYKLDGTELIIKAEDGTPIKSKAHWEGTKLVAETTQDIDKYPVSTSYVYSLDPKGVEMTIIKTLSIQHGYQSQDGTNTGNGSDLFVRAKRSESE